MEDSSAMDNKDSKDIMMEDLPTVMFGRKTKDDWSKDVVLLQEEAWIRCGFGGLHKGRFAHCDVWRKDY